MGIDKKRTHFIIAAGFSADNREAMRLGKYFEKEGFSADAISFYGRGYRDDFSKLSVSECMDNLSKIIAEASEKYDEVFGVGISLGASFLLEYAKKDDRLKGIAGVGVPFKLRKIKLMRLGKIFFPLMMLVWGRLQKIKKWRLSPVGAANMTIEYLDGEFLNNLEHVKTPLLLIHSKKDPVSDYKAVSRFFDVIQSSPKKLIFFDNGDHIVNRDYEKVAKLALDFFDANRH